MKVKTKKDGSVTIKVSEDAAGKIGALLGQTLYESDLANLYQLLHDLTPATRHFRPVLYAPADKGRVPMLMLERTA